MHRTEIKTTETTFNNTTFATINAEAEPVRCYKA